MYNAAKNVLVISYVRNAVVNITYVQPQKPKNTDMPSIFTLFDAIYQLETLYKEFYFTVMNNSSIFNMRRLTKISVATAITSYLRKNKYANELWTTATGRKVAAKYVDYVRVKDESLFTLIETYISNNDHVLATEAEGVIDLAHLAATLECYLDSPIGWIGHAYFGGWGGDVVTGTIDVLNASTAAQRKTGDFIQLAYEHIGAAVGNCNYSDFCCDSDAIMLAKMIEAQNFNYHPLSSAMRHYYTSHVKNRMQYFVDDLNCNCDLESIKVSVRNKMFNIAAFLIWKKEGMDSYQDIPLSVISRNKLRQSVCDAFANYVYKSLGL